MIRAIDTAAVTKRTGKAWCDWLTVPEKIGAHALPHKGIGRCMCGQQCGNSLQASVSKTIPGFLNSVFAGWQALAGIVVTQGAAVSWMDKWRNWRCSLAGSSQVNIGISYKNSVKVFPDVSQARQAPSQAGKPFGSRIWSGCEGSIKNMASFSSINRKGEQ